MSEQAKPDARPTVYVSVHYPDRPRDIANLIVQPAEGGYAVKPARGGPPLAGGATVGEAVDRAVAELERQRAGQG